MLAVLTKKKRPFGPANAITLSSLITCITVQRAIDERGLEIGEVELADGSFSLTKAAPAFDW